MDALNNPKNEQRFKNCRDHAYARFGSGIDIEYPNGSGEHVGQMIFIDGRDRVLMLKKIDGVISLIDAKNLVVPIIDKKMNGIEIKRPVSVSDISMNENKIAVIKFEDGVGQLFTQAEKLIKDEPDRFSENTKSKVVKIQNLLEANEVIFKNLGVNLPKTITPNTDRSRYTGEVIGQTECLSIQKIGDRFIAHRNCELSSVPAVGGVSTVSYMYGRGTVEARLGLFKTIKKGLGL